MNRVTKFHRRSVVARLLGIACGCSLIAATVHGADEPAKPLTAGPFSVRAPSAWTEGVIVEKVPIHPQFTPEEGKRMREAAEAALARKKAGLPPDRSKFPGVPGPPSYNERPEHWAIRFPTLARKGKAFDAKKAGHDPTAPQILIHKTTDWAALIDGSHDEKAEQEIVQRLRRALKKRDTSEPWYLDTDMGFVFLKKDLRFEGGRGFRMLAQDAMEHRILRRGRLCYLFIGMSDDDTCQILASFPIDIPGVPDDENDAEHLGFSDSRYRELRLNYSKYRRLANDWITTNAAKATPSLAELDAMMETLVVKKWE